MQMPFSKMASDECVCMHWSFPVIKRSLNIPDLSVPMVNTIYLYTNMKITVWSRVFLKLCWKSVFGVEKQNQKIKRNRKLRQVHLNMYIYNLVGRIRAMSCGRRISSVSKFITLARNANNTDTDTYAAHHTLLYLSTISLRFHIFV